MLPSSRFPPSIPPFICLSTPFEYRKNYPVNDPGHALSLPPLLHTNFRGKVRVNIIAVDQGFLLIGWQVWVDFSLEYEYYIYNPMTQQYETLTPPALAGVNDDKHDLFYGKGIMGFTIQVDEETGNLTSYRVISDVGAGTNITDSLNLQMFLSETGRWETLTVKSENSVKLHLCNRPVVLNNTLYWTDPSSGRILSHDPYANTNRFCIINLPTHGVVDGSARRDSNCLSHQGCLKYVENVVDGSGMLKSFKIWELKENNGWHLQHKINVNDFVAPKSPYEDFEAHVYNDFETHVRIVSFHPLDESVMYLEWGRYKELRSFNLETKRVQLHNRCSNSPEHEDWLIVKFPCWPILIPPRKTEPELKD
ncbi:OLC1v1017678C2 [Oldenlandia corymbosa var. corymbosa]|nr:OLC1v1017678C2 [Oldenlandia corymbosa var. corymbosa]